MKKTIAFALTLLMCFALLCSCTTERTKGAPDGMKAIESSDKLDYNIYIPAGWVQDLSTGAVSAYCSSSDLSNISMTQFNLEELKPLDEYIAKYTEDLKENLGEFQLSENSPENILLDGVEARKIEYTAKLVGNEYKYMQIVCINGGTIYFFTYTALTEKYDEHTEDVQKILDNFAFKK